MKRWVVYQRERFPLAAHAPLVAAFSASAVGYAALARGATEAPPASAFLVAFATALLFFLQLRIADEFKDFDEDARWRPYRPVPRGLVTLWELGLVGVGAGGVQLALALIYAPALAALLAGVWLWLGLMSREFFAGRWLRAHPVGYMASHMLILPLIDLYATACDWWPAAGRPPDGLIWFLLVSYANGIVVEIGRKVRAPADEEPGVETYSALWGRKTAAGVWLIAVAVTGILAWRAALVIGTSREMSMVLGALVGVCALGGGRVARRTDPGSGRLLEVMSAVWTVAMYLSLGVVPLALRMAW